MGRSPCCEKVGLKKGPWTPEEDERLLAYIEEFGHGSWRALPAKAGLQRCGKSCRLRWTNYLRPDIKRGKFSLPEEQTIIQLHALLGNRWSAIATHLPKRTDNEIKNYWNTHLKKRLTKMGIDPVTHKPTDGALGGSSDDHSAKAAASLSHMAQWESARLEAEARLARESKLRAATSATPNMFQLNPTTVATSANLDVLQNWQGAQIDLESPTSTLSFTESNSLMNPLSRTTGTAISESNSTMLHSRNEETEDGEWNLFEKQPIQMFDPKERTEDDLMGNDEPWFTGLSGLNAGFTGMLLHSSEGQNSSDCCGESNNGQAESSAQAIGDEEKNYWNGVLRLVNSASPSHSPTVF